MSATTGDSEPSAQKRSNRRRVPWWPLVLVMLVVASLLGWRVVKSGTSADRSAASSAKSAAAVRDLAGILNRRAPTLEYLACHDRASDQLAIAQALFQVAQAEYVKALVAAAGQHPLSAAAVVHVDRTSKNLDASRSRLAEAERVTAATTDPDAPPERAGHSRTPHRCPALPLPPRTSLGGHG